MEHIATILETPIHTPHNTSHVRKKTNTVRPTAKQVRLFKNLQAEPETLAEAMIDAGYSEGSATTPSVIMKGKGFQELCNRVGLTDDFILDALKEDIEKKPQQRRGELELASKIKGLYSEKREVEHTHKFSLSSLFRASLQKPGDNSLEITDLPHSDTDSPTLSIEE